LLGSCARHSKLVCLLNMAVVLVNFLDLRILSSFHYFHFHLGFLAQFLCFDYYYLSPSVHPSDLQAF